jgi:hypothetical protein
LPFDDADDSVHNTSISKHPTINELGCRIIKSLDGNVIITEGRLRQTFTVRYPAAMILDDTNSKPKNTTLSPKKTISTNTTAESGAIIRKTRKLRYSWVEQEFSIMDPPKCWEYPLRLLQGTLSLKQLMVCIPGRPHHDTIILNHHYSEKKHLASGLGNIVGVRYVAIPIPQSNMNTSISDSNNSLFNPTQHQVLDHLNPKPIHILSTPIATYRVVPPVTSLASSTSGSSASSSPSLGPYTRLDYIDEVDIEAVLHEDGSIFRSSDGFSFITIYFSVGDHVDAVPTATELEGEMYAVENSPDTARNPRNGRQ